MKRRFPQTHAKERKITVSNYESPALTAELQARMIVEVKHSKPLVTNPESISAAGRWDRAVVLARCSRVKVLPRCQKQVGDFRRPIYKQWLSMG